MPPITPEYSPAIKDLLDQCDKDWGKPEDNKKVLLPYGIEPLDRLLYGLDRQYGEVVLIMGQEKNRKTTFVLNVIANFMTDSRVQIKPFTVIDSLESGNPPKKVRDLLISIVATRHLFSEGHLYDRNCPVCDTSVCRELGITPKFLRFKTRSKTQVHAIEYAIETMKQWPLYIYGANPKQGDTRSLNRSVKTRWKQLIDEYGAEVFMTDHVQQYSYTDEVTDYEKQKRAVAAVADVVAQEQVVALMLSQVSLTSVREHRSGGKLGALGGNKAAAEANTILSTKYEDMGGEMIVKIEDAREAPRLMTWQPLEDRSGSFYGDAYNQGDF